MIKKLPLGLLALLLCCMTEAQFRYGLTAGGIQSHISISSESANYTYRDIILISYPVSVTNQAGYTDRSSVSGSTQSASSWYGGYVFDYFLSSGFAVRWSLLLENKGWKGNFKKSGDWHDPQVYNSVRQDSVGGTERFSLHYLSLPINLLFFAPLKKLKIYFGAGGYIAYGIVGHYTANIAYSSFPEVKDSVAEIAFNTDIDKHKGAYHANAFDWGLSASAGIEFRNGLFINFNYSNGLRDVLINRYGFEDLSTGKFSFILPNRNRAVSIGVGYFISKKKL
jgi:hypothetical protein